MRPDFWTDCATEAAPAFRTSSEQELFLAVVMVAVDDMRSSDALTRFRAEAWMFSPLHEEDFKLVCSYAGLEPEFVQEAAQRAARTAYPRRQGAPGRPRGRRLGPVRALAS